MLNQRFKRLPPDGHIAVQVSSKWSALAGISMFAACKRSSLMLQRAAWYSTTLLGARILPGHTEPWVPPIGDTDWSELASRLRSDVGPFDGIAVHLRRPPTRPGMSVLLMDGRDTRAFVKIRPEGALLTRERLALAALESHEVPFWSPSPLGWGRVGRWHYLALSALPVGIHRMMADPPIDEVVAAMAEPLRSVLPRPPDAMPHWEPMHGDLTPWNLRQGSRGTIALFDWEDNGWGPPGADLLWYDEVCRAAGLAVRSGAAAPGSEAVRFWIERLERRAGGTGEGSLAADVLAKLRLSDVPQPGTGGAGP